MKKRSFFEEIRAKTGGISKGSEPFEPPTIKGAVRFPYGPFQFTMHINKDAPYDLEATTNLKNWVSIFKGTASGEADFLDSEASKFSYRFYRLNSNGLYSAKIIGYASITLAPGFSMVGNPLLGGHDSLPELFKGMPDGIIVSKFDSRLHQLRENCLKDGRWTNPSERIGFGEGAIVFNPSSDYKALTFVGQVKLDGSSIPIPAGFSIQTPSVPEAGGLYPDLRFPIDDGDVIHLFDRDRQKYLLYPYDNGTWSAGLPILGVAESFWVAKRSARNWTYDLVRPN
jgi:hypothetical protein